MPNWVATEVVFKGDNENIKRVLEEVSSKDSQFDFNKLIPMPASLEIESGSKSSLAYAYYCIRKFSTLPPTSHFQDKDIVIDRIEKDITISSQEMLETGKQLYENKEKYGATTWYDWCCNNWGTKWNAHHVEIYDNTMRFATAWSFAEPIMRRLSELCTQYNVGFDGEWADEDMGSNVGYFESYDGEFYYNYHDDNSPEAYATYVRLNGEPDCLDIGADGNYYRHECNESCPHYKECMGG